MAITASQAQGLILTLFGASAGAHLTGLLSATNLSTLAGDAVSTAGLVLGRNLSSDAAFRDLILTENLGLTGTTLTEAQAWMDGEFTKGTSRADIVAAVVTYLEGLTDTTNTFYAAAAAYRASVADAVAWSEGAGATILKVATLREQQGHTEVVAGSSFTLTTATDILVGTAGNDTFTGAATTTGGSDSLIDQTTTDSDVAQLTGQTADIANTFTIKNVEAVEVTAAKVGGTYTVNADKFSGVNTLTVSRGAVAEVIDGKGAVEVKGLSQAVKAVKAGAGVTALTVKQDLSTITATGIAVDAAGVTGDVTVVGAATVTANSVGSTKSVSVVGTGTATLDVTNVKVDAAAAGSVYVGYDNAGSAGNATTGTVEINAAAAKTVKASVAGGGTINANSATAITAIAIDDSGLTINDSKAHAKTAAGTFDLAGTTGTTDAATVNAAGYVNLTTNTTAQIENVTLSGNGAAATYTITGAPSVTTIAGDQSVTVKNSAGNLSGKTVTDASTAGTSTVELNAAGAGSSTTDLSKISADGITFGVDMGANASASVQLKDGATVTVAADQTYVTLAGKTTKATLNLATADDTAASGATIDITAGNVGLTNYTTVNLDASVGKFTATAFDASTSAVVNVTGSKAVQLNTGSGALKAKEISAAQLTGNLSAIQTADSVKLTSGSGQDSITLSGSAVFTTSTNDGDDAVTVSTASDGSAVTTGNGDDTINLNAAGVFAINTGEGSDSVIVDAATDANLNGAGGSDTLEFVASRDLSEKTSFAFAGFEKVALTKASTTIALTLNEAQLGSNTFTLSGAGGDDTLVIVDKDAVGTASSNKYTAASAASALDASKVTVSSTAGAAVIIKVGQGSNTITGTAATNDTVDTSLMNDIIDKDVSTNTVAASGTVVNLSTSAITNTDILSNLSMKTGVNVTSVAAGSVAYLYTGTITAATASNATSTVSAVENITGSAGKDYLVGNANANSINGGAGVDYLVGGAGDDTLTGGADADTIIGGTGADSIVLTEASAAADTLVYAAGDSSSTSADSVTAFAGSSDVIKFSSALTIVTDATAAATGKASISAAGLASFAAADDTLAEMVTAVEASIQTGTATAGQTAIFGLGSDGYMFISDGVDGVTSSDVLIKLVGVATTGTLATTHDAITLSSGTATLS